VFPDSEATAYNPIVLFFSSLTPTVAISAAMKHPVQDRVKPVICNF